MFNKMDLENNNIELGNGSDNFEYINPSSFEKLVFPENLPAYEGEGETSFSEKYDAEKKAYLNSLGIEIPEEWEKDRAMFISTFVVTGVFLVLEGVKRDDKESFEEVLIDKNRQLKDARVDTYGYRRRLTNGLLVEDYHRNLGFSANPQKKVSEEELKQVVGFVAEQLGQSR